MTKDAPTAQPPVTTRYDHKGLPENTTRGLVERLRTIGKVADENARVASDRYHSSRRGGAAWIHKAMQEEAETLRQAAERIERQALEIEQLQKEQKAAGAGFDVTFKHAREDALELQSRAQTAETLLSGAETLIRLLWKSPDCQCEDCERVRSFLQRKGDVGPIIPLSHAL